MSSVSNIFSSLSSGMFACLALSLPVHAETLSDVLSDAYNGNAEIQAERFTLRQTDEQVPQALSGWPSDRPNPGLRSAN